ncbi:MAG: M23 family metallopeptidase [Hyphomonadaceae bacterium]
MRALAGAFVAFMLVACAAAEAPAQPESAPVVADAPAESTEAANPPAPETPSLRCAGAFTQGGVVLCRAMPGAIVSLNGARVGAADADGWIVIGFTREHPANAEISASMHNAVVTERYDVAPREFDIQRINGLPQQTVTPTDPAVLARIQRESALKQAAFRSEANIEGFLEGFIRPVEGGTVTGRWGNQRILNGTPSTPHFGYDIAVPEGTPIRAPAGGVVTLAESDMHYEGGLVFIDHGQGLITMYLHMSRVDVRVGDRLEQGQIIGAVGSSGRATGPHLCWRMKLRNTQQLDPSVAIEGLAQARAELLGAN